MRGGASDDHRPAAHPDPDDPETPVGRNPRGPARAGHHAAGPAPAARPAGRHRAGAGPAHAEAHQDQRALGSGGLLRRHPVAFADLHLAEQPEGRHLLHGRARPSAARRGLALRCRLRRHPGRAGRDRAHQPSCGPRPGGTAASTPSAPRPWPANQPTPSASKGFARGAARPRAAGPGCARRSPARTPAPPAAAGARTAAGPAPRSAGSPRPGPRRNRSARRT